MRYLSDGSFDGLNDIEPTVILNDAGTSYSSTVYGRVLNVNGTVRVEVCGTANGERMAIE